ncbi:MAG: hypothetical protein ABJF01_03655 [bacterium]
MGDYRARLNELLGQAETYCQNLPAPVFEGVSRRIYEVVAVRKAVLDDVAASLASSGTDSITRPISDKCQAALTQVVIPLASLCNALKKEDAEWIEDWLEASASADSRFFKSLDAMGLGDIRDQMLALDAGLTQMIGILDRKWSTMSEENQRIEKVEQDASAQMSAIVQKAMSRGADAVNQLGNLTQKVLEPMMRIPDLVNEAVVYLAIEAGVPEAVAKLIPKISLAGKDTFAGAKELGIPAGDVAKALQFLSRDPGMAASEAVQRVFGSNFEILVAAVVLFYKNVLPEFVTDYRIQVATFQSALPNQGTILVSLSQTRADVDAFLENSGMEKVQALFEKALRALEDWENGMPTPGLKADAAELRAVAKEVFTRRFEATTHNFEEFVRANKGRFVGTIEKDTETALLWTDIWVDRTKGIANLGMDARLKDWKANTLTITDRFDSAAQQVRQQLIGLPIGVAEPILKRLDAEFAKMRDQLKPAVESTISAVDATAPTVTPEQITRDLDRSRLRERLYA